MKAKNLEVPSALTVIVTIMKLVLSATLSMGLGCNRALYVGESTSVKFAKTPIRGPSVTPRGFT